MCVYMHVYLTNFCNILQREFADRFVSTRPPKFLYLFYRPTSFSQSIVRDSIANHSIGRPAFWWTILQTLNSLCACDLVDVVQYL